MFIKEKLDDMNNTLHAIFSSVQIELYRQLNKNDKAVIERKHIIENTGQELTFVLSNEDEFKYIVTITDDESTVTVIKKEFNEPSLLERVKQIIHFFNYQRLTYGVFITDFEKYLGKGYLDDMIGNFNVLHANLTLDCSLRLSFSQHVQLEVSRTRFTYTDSVDTTPSVLVMNDDHNAFKLNLFYVLYQGVYTRYCDLNGKDMNDYSVMKRFLKLVDNEIRDRIIRKGICY